MTQTIHTGTPEETRAAGAALAKTVHGGEVLRLHGELGAGKTTFLTGFIQYFLPRARVLSPTFTFMRSYQIQHETIAHIYHLDLYRLPAPQAVEQFGLSDIMQSTRSLTLIEWPQKGKLPDMMPYIDISFTITEADSRLITISS